MEQRPLGATGPELSMRDKTLQRIVSGGQTGVDRGALDAALAAGFSCGGWCPEGREAEDGPIPCRYPMTTLPGGGYLERTRRNVIDSDATVVICFGELSGGPLKTVEFCDRFGKPVVVLDGNAFAPDTAASKAAAFVRSHAIRILNVAGPRESGHSGARTYAEQVIGLLLRLAR